MNPRIGALVRLGLLSIAAVLATAGLEAPTLSGAAVFAAEPKTQTHRGGGVVVQVTPRSLAPDAPVWEFQVAFDTHTVALDGDPATFSTLIDSNGRVHEPLAWEGDPPGGHHRKGVLRFRPLAGEAQVELRINGVAGVATRTFHWRP